jgi:sugar phosphate permease
VLLYGVNFLVQVQREMWSLSKSQLKNTIKVFTST